MLHDPSVRVRDHAYHAYPRAKLGRCIRTERYRLVQWLNPGQPESKAEYELYDYRNGPVERENIATKRPAVLTRLQEKLAAYPNPILRNPDRRR